MWWNFVVSITMFNDGHKANNTYYVVILTTLLKELGIIEYQYYYCCCRICVVHDDSRKFNYTAYDEDNEIAIIMYIV